MTNKQIMLFLNKCELTTIKLDKLGDLADIVLMMSLTNHSNHIIANDECTKRWMCMVIPCLTPTHQNILGDHKDLMTWNRFPHYWPFVNGIHRSLVVFSHKD